MVQRIQHGISKKMVSRMTWGPQDSGRFQNILALLSCFSHWESRDTAVSRADTIPVLVGLTVQCDDYCVPWVGDSAFLGLPSLMLGSAANPCCSRSPREPILTYLFIYLFLVAPNLHRCVWAFSPCGERGLLSICNAWASHCGGFSCCKAQALGQAGSVIAALRLHCSPACGIFPDQGSNPGPLHLAG